MKLKEKGVKKVKSSRFREFFELLIRASAGAVCALTAKIRIKPQ